MGAAKTAESKFLIVEMEYWNRMKNVMMVKIMVRMRDVLRVANSNRRTNFRKTHQNRIVVMGLCSATKNVMIITSMILMVAHIA